MMIQIHGGIPERVNEVEVWHLMEEESTILEAADENVKTFMERGTRQFGQWRPLSTGTLIVVSAKQQDSLQL